MEKKVKDLTEDEMKMICDHYGDDCDGCPLQVDDEGCVYYGLQQTVDIQAALRNSIRPYSGINCIQRNGYFGGTEFTCGVKYYKDGKIINEKCNSSQEAQQRCEELRKQFDEQWGN